MKTKTPAIIFGVVLFVILLGVGGFYLLNKRDAVDAASAVETSEVTITSDGFGPETIKVKVGTKVTWTNNDSSAHKVASDPHPIHTDEPELESENLSTGDTFSYTFTEPGEYTYHCHIHPNMKGAVIVE